MSMEEDEGAAIFESGEEEKQQEDKGGEKDLLQLLDSLDSYLTLIDSVNSSLRGGWLDLASARHSMGVSRVNASLLDLNDHPAATTIQVIQQRVDSTGPEPQFTLRKWASSDSGKGSSADAKSEEEKPQNPQLRHRGSSEEKPSPKNGTLIVADDEVKKEKTKSLSVFGTLVSPKLRSAQLSFETALETLVEIANMRLSMLSAFDRVQKELEAGKR